MTPPTVQFIPAAGATLLVEYSADLGSWNSSGKQWIFSNDSSSDSTIINDGGNNRWDIDDQWIRNGIGSGYADKDAFYAAYPTAYAVITVTSGGSDYSWTYDGQGTGFSTDLQWTTTTGPSVADVEDGGNLGFTGSESVSIKVYA